MTTVKREITFTIYESYPQELIYTIQRKDGTVIAYIHMKINSKYNYKARTTNVFFTYSMVYNEMQTITKQERDSSIFLFNNLINTQSHDITSVIGDNLEERINGILPMDLRLVKGS